MPVESINQGAGPTSRMGKRPAARAWTLQLSVRADDNPGCAVGQAGLSSRWRDNPGTGDL